MADFNSQLVQIAGNSGYEQFMNQVNQCFDTTDDEQALIQQLGSPSKLAFDLVNNHVNIDELLATIQQNSPYVFTKQNICKLLNLEYDGVDETYTALCYPERVTPGCLAFIHRSKTSPIQRMSDVRVKELAKKAIDGGAKRLLFSRQIEDYPCLIVPEPPLYSMIEIMSQYCGHYFPYLKVEITGSYGKTTTTMLVEAVLSEKYKVYGLKGVNDNTLPCVVKRVQSIQDSYNAFVQEVMEAPTPCVPGMVSRIVHPDYAIVTSVGTSHLERMKTRERILESCMSIEQGMVDSGVMILNGDDPYLIHAETSHKTVYYGMENEYVHFRAVNVQEREDALEFEILHDGIATPIRLQCIGKHNAQNAAAAFAVAKMIGMSDEEAAHGLSQFRVDGIRQNLVSVGGYRMLLDCYNASVESMKSTIETVSTIPMSEGGRRIAVLADVLESGTMDEEIHRSIGKYVAQSNIDELICYGKSARWIAEEARKRENLIVRVAESHGEITALLEKSAGPLDLVLWKGSHGMGLIKAANSMLGTWYDERRSLSRVVSDGPINYRVFNDYALAAKCNKDAVSYTVLETVDCKPVQGIDVEAFCGSTLETIQLPSTLRNLRSRAFMQAKKLKRIVVPGSVLFIGERAFLGCTSLKEVIIQEGCRHIDNRVFYKCSALERLVLPSSIRQIHDSAFIGCKNLTIYSRPGTYAEQFAKEHQLKFQAIDL